MKNRFKRGLLLALWLSTPAWAGFGEGYAAYNKGDYATALQEYLPLATQGNVAAQFNLALTYENGIGVTRNYYEAVRWFRKVAENSNVEAKLKERAQERLNQVLLLLAPPVVASTEITPYKQLPGWPCVRDMDCAGDLICGGNTCVLPRTATVASGSHFEQANAQFEQGWFYQYGQGVAKDEAEAVRWYRKAADQGYAKAQNHLGGMYEYGHGVTRDEAEAVRWYRMAVQNSNADAAQKERAQNNLSRVELRLSHSPVASATIKPLSRQAGEYCTRDVDCAGNLICGGTICVLPRTATAVPTAPALPVLEIAGGNNIRLKQGTYTLEGVARGAGVVEITINDEIVAQTANRQAKELAFSYRRYFTVGETVLRVTATNQHGQSSTQTVKIVREVKPKW